MKPIYSAIRSGLPAENWLIALDRDGTLVPYADRPEEARVTPDLRELIAHLAEQPGFQVAVISARSVAQLAGDFKAKRLILAGNYGVEVQFPDGRLCIQPQALDAVPALKACRDQLFVSIDKNAGAILEDHGYSLCLHWHNVPISRREELHTAVGAIEDRCPHLAFRRLQTSYEVLPDFPWNKGLALAFIDENLRPSAQILKPPEAKPVTESVYFFAGDSHADMPAFRWINEHGGISVRVGRDECLGAQFRLNEPADLLRLLDYLCRNRAG